MTDESELRTLTDRLDRLEESVEELQRAVDRRHGSERGTARSGDGDSGITGERGWVPVAVATVEFQIRLLERLEQRLVAAGSGDRVGDAWDVTGGPGVDDRNAVDHTEDADTTLDPQVTELLEALRRLDREIRDELVSAREHADEPVREASGSGRSSGGVDSDVVDSSDAANAAESRGATVNVEAELESIRRRVRGDTDADEEASDDHDEEASDDHDEEASDDHDEEASNDHDDT